MALELQAHHPTYDERSPDWEIVADCYAGERAVKAKGTTYLPSTSGMRDPQTNQLTAEGRLAYDAYKMRAVFHDFVRQAVTGLVGVVHRKPPVVNVPEALKPMVASMTIAGESLEILWQRITEQQLVAGHGGLLVDVPDGVPVSEATPYVALYSAASILNWNAGARRQGRQALQLVVLDETSARQGDDLTWASVTQIRVLALGAVATKLGGEPDAETVIAPNDYQVAVAEPNDTGKLVLGEFKAPSIGALSLDQIPFVAFNTNDTVMEPCTPPLLGLALLALAIYRAEADYRQQLHMQGQDTLKRIGATPDPVTGLTPEVRTGAGAVIDLNLGGDAEFIGISSSGLSEQRSALENDKAQASTHIVELLDTGAGEAESGEALRVRVSARTAKLSSMQLTAAATIRDCLVLGGRWLSLPQAALDAIEVIPNLDFADDIADPQTVNVLVEAKLKGAPITWRMVHDWMRKHELTDKSFEETLEEMAAEETDAATGKTGVDIDPAASPKPIGAAA